LTEEWWFGIPPPLLVIGAFFGILILLASISGGLEAFIKIARADLFENTTPRLNRSLIRVLIESIVDFYKIENFRISFQRKLLWNLEVSPATSAYQVISQRLHSLSATD